MIPRACVHVSSMLSTSLALATIHARVCRQFMSPLQMGTYYISAWAGVNPMITVEAMAYMVAEGLAQEFSQNKAQAAAKVHAALMTSHEE